ncbi:MAG: hypothetical protein P4L34_12310 [Paludibacter sp.]|nr:hypothetical protein [Paludibacter sp.]
MNDRKNILIDEIGKELPFTVPENYFNQFALKIEDQIGYGNTLKRKLLKPWMYMTAMFVGILIMSQIFYTIHQNNLTKNAENYESYVLSQVDESTLMDYYVEQSKK